MFILAFETSCDDTSIAIFNNSSLIALDTISQIKEHNETCGVVPEVAARLHANNIFKVLDEVLEKAEVKLEQIDYIACTEDPGLLPSLLVGMTVAKTLSKILKKPYISVDHIKAHIFSNLLERDEKDIVFPSICLTVSGGHNELYLWKSLFDMELIGETLDDSAGEAFDKVSKMMSLGYPGGPIISKLASEFTGNYKGIFPVVLLDKNSLDFSFSGLKSAVKREVDKRITNYELQITNGKNDNILNSYSVILDTSHVISAKAGIQKKDSNGFSSQAREGQNLNDEDKKEIAFEFENTVVEILAHKLFQASEKYGVKSVVLAGGVSANDKLINEISKKALDKNYNFIYPTKKIYSQDNAAMVGILAYYKIKN